ncbi:MAG: ABC transporter ATP-binding protein, partial [Alphaproteobacteria bacterium]
MSELKLTDVSKDYGHVQVLKHINLDIVSGEFMVFVG